MRQERRTDSHTTKRTQVSLNQVFCLNDLVVDDENVFLKLKTPQTLIYACVTLCLLFKIKCVGLSSLRNTKLTKTIHETYSN